MTSVSPHLPETLFSSQSQVSKVGGRLQAFWKVWEQLGADPWVVSTLREGYNIEFESPPPLTNHPIFGLNSDHPQVNVEIQKMIDKGALELVHNIQSPGFYSRIFVVPKKTGDLRPVIDLKALNVFLKAKPFKMETPQTIRRSLKKGMWVFSIDLKDAYFHIPIHPASRKFLRITMGNQVFQFKALPFGISSAPWLFTKIFKQIAVILRSRNVYIHQYLDDWLNKQWSKEQSLLDRQRTLELCLQAGCIINWDKSDLEPTQHFDFVGVHFDLEEDLVRPSQDKLHRVQEKAKSFIHNKFVPAQEWESLLGLLNQLEAYVPWGKIHIRPIQYNLHALFRPQVDQHFIPVPVWFQTLKAIQWWINQDNFFKGCPIHPVPYQYRICTDASLEGWGAHMDQNKVFGSWSQQEVSLHINVLELRAVRLALLHFNLPNQSVILVSSDNSTVVAYINKQGGTRSQTLMEETYLLFNLLQSREWSLRASYLPGAKNVIADALSRRNQVIPSEWSLHPLIVKRIFKVWQTPLIDLFATKRNTKLPLYISPVPDPEAWAEDALSVSWKGLLGYAYPPPAIMSKVLEKILLEECQVILIASAWPTQSWFNLLLDLSIDHPLRLPVTEDLLKQTDKPMFHSNPGHLKLHAWNLQGGICKNKVIPVNYQTESWVHKDLPQEKFMELDGQSFVLGVSPNRKILSRPLPLL